jgi:hypothetical protein
LNKKAKDKQSIELVNAAFTADSMAIQLLFYKAVDKKVIVQKNGIFMYGTAPLGPSEDSVIEYLQGPGNRELILQIERGVNPIETVKEVAKEVVMTPVAKEILVPAEDQVGDSEIPKVLG